MQKCLHPESVQTYAYMTAGISARYSVWGYLLATENVNYSIFLQIFQAFDIDGKNRVIFGDNAS